MKQSVYEKLEDIPQIDRDESNYQLCTDKNSPNNGKYVLLLDGAHPVQQKNTELLAEKATTKQTHDAKIAEKDAEIQRVTAERDTARTQSGLPAGQIAVSADDAQLLNKFKGLGNFDEVQTKVTEYGTLKEQTEAATRKTLYSEIAKAHNLDPDAFAKIAERVKLHEKIETREEVPDPKKPEEKVNRYYVKGKNPTTQADTTTIISEFVKTDDEFKPFLSSLIPTNNKEKTRKLPNTNVGEEVEETSASSSYLSGYKNRAKEKTDKAD